MLCTTIATLVILGTQYCVLLLTQIRVAGDSLTQEQTEQDQQEFFPLLFILMILLIKDIFSYTNMKYIDIAATILFQCLVIVKLVLKN